MTSSPFRVVEHVVPAQHIREYPRATSGDQEATLHLAVKQYIPVDNPNPQPGDVTIIGAHANGFPKELYEPLWEDLHTRAKSQGFRIRGIWIADVAHQGQSSALNEDHLGNDPSWFDHPRDLLYLINQKRAEMPRPIIGIGHSMGGNNLINLALLHPRLLTTLVLFDPVIQRDARYPSQKSFHTIGATVPNTTQLSTYRRDIWPSREDAAKGFEKSPFYQGWDRRVLDRWVQYGLRDLPTAIHPLDEKSIQDGKKPVTLSTSRHQEVFTFSRPIYTQDGSLPKRVTHPDLNDETFAGFPFYRPEGQKSFSNLPYLRPSVLYGFAGKSDLSMPELRQDKLDNTGIGIGGSGGAPEGRVKAVLLEDVGHLMPMEAVSECADAAAQWVGAELQRWREHEQIFQENWSKKSKVAKMTVDEEWLARIKAPVKESRKKPDSKL